MLFDQLVITCSKSVIESSIDRVNIVQRPLVNPSINELQPGGQASSNLDSLNTFDRRIIRARDQFTSKR